MQSALTYMGLTPGMALEGLPVADVAALLAQLA
jgi:hypothetical protein